MLPLGAGIPKGTVLKYGGWVGGSLSAREAIEVDSDSMIISGTFRQVGFGCIKKLNPVPTLP
jgi:hypothetical protein